MAASDEWPGWYVECANHDCRRPIALGEVEPHVESVPKPNKYELTCPHCGHAAAYAPSLARRHKDPYRD
jgi:predicted RNA-binding Zn-ribbon protein involved in translation (DUF1610 family)